MGFFTAPMNQKLTSLGEATGLRRDVGGWGRSPVLVALSGGGTRAAALSYGVMKHLYETKLSSAAGPLGLLGDVEVISSASGGSFPAAYYGLFGERLFDDFRKRFLTRNIIADLVLEVVKPINWPRLASPRFDRIDLAAEVYDRLFEKCTFADLKKRPSIVMNATNMALGARFSFTQEQFDQIGSNLGSYSIARAVAASSAFPVGFSPLTLENHGAPADFSWDDDTRAVKSDVHSNLERFRQGVSALAYRDTVRHRFCHLVDGGLADNTGVRHLLDVLHAENDSPSLVERIVDGSIDRLVFIIVNAKGRPSEKKDRYRRGPGFIDVLLSAGTVAMDNYADDSVVLLEDAILSLQRALIEKCRHRTKREWRPIDNDDPGLVDKRILLPVPPLKNDDPISKMVPVYIIHVTFAAVADEQQRERLLEVATTFHLPDAIVDEVIAAAGPLLEETPGWQALLSVGDRLDRPRSLDRTPPRRGPDATPIDAPAQPSGPTPP